MTNTAARPTTTTMRAIVQVGYGDAEVLRPAERPLPRALRDDEVLVRVHAAGLDRGTWHLMTGTPYAVRLVMGLRRPRQPVPGLDLSGTVAAVGSGVTRFAPGDEVYGIGTGTFAEYAVAREAKLATKPATLTHAQAATVPVSATTALQSVTDIAGVDCGPARAGHRGLGWRRQLRGADRGGGRRRGHRREQRREGRPGPVAGCRARARLRPRRLRGGCGPLRRDHRHRRQHLAVPAAPSADADRHRGPRGWRGRRPAHRHGPPAPRPGRVPVRAAAADDARAQGERRRPRAAHRPDRGRSGHAQRGRDVPAGRRGRGDARPGGRAGPRQGRDLDR